MVARITLTDTPCGTEILGLTIRRLEDVDDMEGLNNLPNIRKEFMRQFQKMRRRTRIANRKIASAKVKVIALLKSINLEIVCQSQLEPAKYLSFFSLDYDLSFFLPCG